MKHFKVLILAAVCSTLQANAHAALTFTSSELVDNCPSEELCILNNNNSSILVLTNNDVNAIEEKTSELELGQSVAVRTERKHKLVCKLNPKETRPAFTCTF